MSLFRPGAAAAAEVMTDEALLRGLVEVERAWLSVRGYDARPGARLRPRRPRTTSSQAALAIGAWILRTPSDAEVEEQTRAAQAAAERAVVPLLSYDAGNLEESKKAAHAVLTDRYRKTYDQFFEGVVEQNAPNTGTRIEVNVLASAIARSGEDRVQVLLFVDRPTTNKKTSTPVVYKDQVTLTMVRRGDRWLVDGIDTTPLSE